MSAAPTLQTGRFNPARAILRPNAKSLEDGVGGDVASTVAFPRRKPAERFEPELSMLRLVADEEDELDTTTLEREFPTISLERAAKSTGIELTIDDFAWRGAFDSSRFDEAIEHARPIGLVAVRGLDAVGVAREVLARYQRLVLRRNDASSTPMFDAALEAHSMLFDPAEFKIEHEHALDTWQWMLRLDPSVGIAPQLAALLHDIGRLESEPHDRIEHRVHRSIDDVQSKLGGDRALAILQGIGVDEQTAVRVQNLVSGTEPTEREATLLDDADALSFLSLGSSRYADHFGLAQTRRKVLFVLGRLSDAAREKVALFRLRPDVDRLVRAG